MNQETNNVRRYPRTLQQAFGPCTDNHVEPKPLTTEEKTQQANRELIAATLLAALAGIAGLFIVFVGLAQ